MARKLFNKYESVHSAKAIGFDWGCHTSSEMFVDVEYSALPQEAPIPSKL